MLKKETKSDLENEILKKYDKLCYELNENEKKKVHFKSVENFIFYLIKNPKYKKENIKLQKIGEDRMKKLLFEYLTVIQTKRLIEINDYKKYIQEIGSFMMKYYNFSYFGGKIIYFNLLLFLSVGLLFDFFVYLFLGRIHYVFFILFLLIFILSSYRKYKTKRIFGYNY